MFWKIAFQAITGNLSGIVSAVTGHLGKLSDNETAKLKAALRADKEVAVAQLQAQASAYNTRVDLMKGMWITQWLIAAALVPPLLHQGMIFLDSTPFPYFTLNDYLWPEFHAHIQGSWKVEKAPPPYDEREWLLVSALLGIQGALTVGMGAVKAVLRR